MLVEKKIARKKQIEQQATALFHQKGYAASSMRDLAGLLGIEAASIYSHVKSKEEILQRICFRMAKEFFESLEAIEQEAYNAVEKLEKAIVAHVEVITKDPSASAVFFSEWRHLSEPHLSEFLEMRERYEDKFRQYVREGMQDEVFETVDERFTVLTLLSSINYIPGWFNPDGKLQPDEIGHKIARLFIKGLEKRISN